MAVAYWEKFCLAPTGLHGFSLPLPPFSQHSPAHASYLFCNADSNWKEIELHYSISCICSDG